MVNYELLQLILLLNKDRYNKYNSLINEKELKENTKELYYIYQCIKELHSLYEKDIELKELQAFFYAKYPNATKDAAYDALFSQADVHAAMDGAMAELVLSKVRERRLSLNISEAAYNLAQGIGTQEQLSTLFKELGDTHASPLAETDEALFVTTDLEDLVNNAVMKPGLRWRLDFLNKSLGSLRKGDFGFVFARPETGKTTFLASEISYMLNQTDLPIVWFNNEEQGSKVMLRIYQAYFGVTLQQLIGNAAKYKAMWSEAVGNKLKLVDSASISKTDVEKVLSSLGNVGLILFDQIDKIKGFEADRKDLALGAVYQWARELAKTYAPTIGVCQADGTGEGQKWLTMQNVADAKTSKQAEADWIVGIGKSHDINEEVLRFFNISKNKLQGDEDSIPELRHGRQEVVIKPQTARYEDLIRY